MVKLTVTIAAAVAAAAVLVEGSSDSGRDLAPPSGGRRSDGGRLRGGHHHPPPGAGNPEVPFDGSVDESRSWLDSASFDGRFSPPHAGKNEVPPFPDRDDLRNTAEGYRGKMQADLARRSMDPKIQAAYSITNPGRTPVRDVWLETNQFLPMINNVNTCGWFDFHCHMEKIRRKSNFF
ncbi:unnamed protein product [Phytophthora lilii]|uniref:Unnamed protein product n=1 Tax=Phytophthora lilii TaxID=2077276 RepID=A0A9W6U642_9STRA|nr:unnamed protein product [Phytophthora lilii]